MQEGSDVQFAADGILDDYDHISPKYHIIHKTQNLKTIIVPIDFSEASYNAVDYALHFVQVIGASLSLTHVVNLLQLSEARMILVIFCSLHV